MIGRHDPWNLFLKAYFYPSKRVYRFPCEHLRIASYSNNAWYLHGYMFYKYELVLLTSMISWFDVNTGIWGFCRFFYPWMINKSDKSVNCSLDWVKYWKKIYIFTIKFLLENWMIILLNLMSSLYNTIIKVSRMWGLQELDRFAICWLNSLTNSEALQMWLISFCMVQLYSLLDKKYNNTMNALQIFEKLLGLYGIWTLVSQYRKQCASHHYTILTEKKCFMCSFDQHCFNDEPLSISWVFSIVCIKLWIFTTVTAKLVLEEKYNCKCLINGLVTIARGKSSAD